MVQRHYQYCVLAAAAVALSAGVLHAALPTAPDVSGATSLTGQLLIATPRLRGPPFDHAVVVVARHSRDGALGIVINRPLAVRSIADVLAAFGADIRGVTGNVHIFIGGPVEPQVGFVLHSAGYRDGDTVDIDGRLALSSAPDVLRAIGLGRGPPHSLFAFGYAGWGPAQLDDEIAQGAWRTVPEDPALVFDDERSRVWSDAMARYKPER